MNPPIQYAAVLPQVREVSLLGTADLAFWKDRLAKEELVPAETNGQAQVLVIAADSKFMGVPFREVSFSVLVSPPTGRVLPGGAFLVRAFNSCRFFAFCERVWFSTPYDHGEVRVSAAAPVSIRLTHRRQELFRAEMSPREPARVGDGGWHGPVYLPARKNGPGPLFFARLQGHTRTYPFLPERDVLEVRPAPDAEVFQALIDSRFAGREWAVRDDATHAKSKTYRRSDAPVGP